MNTILYNRADLRRRGIDVTNSTLLRYEAEGRFPKRVRLGRYIVAWVGSEIDDYIAALSAAREVGR